METAKRLAWRQLEKPQAEGKGSPRDEVFRPPTASTGGVGGVSECLGKQKDQLEAFWREEGGSRSRRETHPLKGGEVKAGGRGKESGEEHK